MEKGFWDELIKTIMISILIICCPILIIVLMGK